MMHGEEDLSKLLMTLSPVIRAGEFVFCTFQEARYGEYANLDPIAVVAESEGLTLVIPKSKADEYAIAYESIFKCITLTVHSSLNAVGLTAAFASKLAEQRISANVVAGYFHDHIFVQSEVAEQAVAALNELTEGQA